MELQQHFDELAETLSAKYPTIKNTVYLYLLVVVMMILDRGNQWLLAHNSFLINSRIYKEIESFIYEDYEKIVEIILNDLVDRNLFLGVKNDDLVINENGVLNESPFKDSFRELCKYLIAKCLEIENQVELCDVENLWKEISKREPNAIQLENKIKISTVLDFLSQKMGPSDSQSVQIGIYNSSVNFSKLSDKTYQELSEAFIAQSFFYEKYYLQCFSNLDGILAKTANPNLKQEIFNPNCGIGSSFIELQKQFPNHELRFTGRVDDGFFRILCEANLLAYNVKAYIAEEEMLDSDIEITFWDEMPDIAMGIVPLNIENTEKLDKKFFPLSHKRKKVEYSFIELMINCLGESGKAVVVVPEKFLYRWNAKGFKKAYLKNDWIESVISLPEDTFKDYGSYKTAIVVFNKNKTEKGFITFQSADNQFEDTKVSLEEILSLDRLDLRVGRYALKEAKELKNIFANTNYSVIKIRDVIQKSISGANYSPKNRIDEDSVEDLPYIRVSDLARNETEFDLDISKVERKISREKAHKRTIIDFSAVLVSKIAPKLKPTYFKFISQPIVIGSDVIALKLKEDVNVEYFITQLHAHHVQIQVEMMSSGVTIQRITKEDFLNIQIILPPLEEQKQQVLEIRGIITEKIIAEEKLIEAQFDVVANINHSLKNKLAVIINDYDTLVRFLKRRERKSETIKFDEAISANAVGDDIDTLEIITDRLKTNLSDASKVFNNALKIQKQNLKKEVVELVQFFRNEVKPLYIGKNYSIEVFAKPNLKLNVWLDKDAFKDVIENLIENAKSHGFIDNEKHYRIVFDLSKLKEGEGFDDNTSTKFARIIYKNDGKPFPKNFSFEDYKQFSNKAGKTQGTGIGGYVINKIVELHDGIFNFIAPSDDFTVEFEIILPLEN